MTHSKDPIIIFKKQSLIIDTYRKLIDFKLSQLYKEKDSSKLDDIIVKIFDFLNSLNDEV